MSSLKLFTIKDLGSAVELISTGKYVCREGKSELLSTTPSGFGNAYYWMMKRLAEKVSPAPSRNVRSPVWAWGDLDYEYWKEDAGSPGEMLFRIDFEIDDSRVLASDFMNWYMVLCDTPFVETEEEMTYYESLLKIEQERYKHKSWEKIFIIDPDSVAQYVFWELELEAVISITPFVVPGVPMQTLN